MGSKRPGHARELDFAPGRRLADVRRRVQLPARRSLLLPVLAGTATLALGVLIGVAVGLTLPDPAPEPQLAEAKASQPAPAAEPERAPKVSDNGRDRASARRSMPAMSAGTGQTERLTELAFAPSGAGGADEADDKNQAHGQTAKDQADDRSANGTHTGGVQLAAWQLNALPLPEEPESGPRIALVIDDLGPNRANTDRVVKLPGPLTLAFLVYADELPQVAARARAAGHELLAHVPMEPEDTVHHDPGPNVLKADLAPEELRRRLAWGLDRYSGFVGVNNHMGSRFTASAAGMRPVMAELRRRGLLFLDSKTTADTVGPALAREFGVPHAARDVFLDNDPAAPAIREQLLRLEKVARRTGLAIGIGHPYDSTIEALAEWLPTLRARGFRLVPVSAIVRARERRASG